MKTIEELRITHWHKADLTAWETVSESIPAVIETNLKLWARRIERKDGPHVPHKYLHAICAHHYAKRADGVFAPDGEEMTFLCAVESSTEARHKVEAQLAAHGFNPQEWALGSSCAPLILA